MPARYKPWPLSPDAEWAAHEQRNLQHWLRATKPHLTATLEAVESKEAPLSSDGAAYADFLP